MAFVKIWIHAVWGTKNRENILEKGKREKLFAHIRENARKKGIYIDFINGVEDHAKKSIIEKRLLPKNVRSL